MPVFDSTFLIALEREPGRMRPLLSGLMEGDEDLVVPATVAGEVATGADDPAEAVRKIMEAFAFAPMGPDIAVEVGRLAQQALRAGRFPGWSDIQVAATARHEGMAVVTANGKHFEALGVRVIEHP